ncbi:MAG: PilT/PilU family type 4a pilus ATPase [Elusimicrobia bacterium]|nr:PilT/PilU family type 4a pilus ATPase [Elusimicrobiota bacterium]
MEILPLLQELRNKKASDLHIRANGPSYLRIDGELISLNKTFSADETSAIAQSLMNEERKSIFRVRHEVDMALNFNDLGRFRINAFTQRGMVNMAFRYIPSNIPNLKDLKLPQAIEKISENRRGLVLVTGTTGCGKSTTLASMIDHINSTHSANIITIEDPIEFVHADKKAIFSQRELGTDTLTYFDALRNVVRQDPDVILVGEMRDLETVSTAITAAQTGHLVLSTIHTIDAIQTVTRIIDLFPPHQQNQARLILADTLKAVISQRLLPHASGVGRVPAVEVLVVNGIIKKLIEDSKLSEVLSQMKQGQYYGMQTFNQALVGLLRANEIKLEDALLASANPEEIKLAIRGIQSSSEDAMNFIERQPKI